MRRVPTASLRSRDPQVSPRSAQAGKTLTAKDPFSGGADQLSLSFDDPTVPVVAESSVPAVLRPALGDALLLRAPSTSADTGGFELCEHDQDADDRHAELGSGVDRLGDAREARPALLGDVPEPFEVSRPADEAVEFPDHDPVDALVVDVGEEAFPLGSVGAGLVGAGVPVDVGVGDGPVSEGGEAFAVGDLAVGAGSGTVVDGQAGVDGDAHGGGDLTAREHPSPRSLVDSRKHGFCLCGCGAQTPPAKKTDRRKGLVKGQPVWYLRGHQTRYNELPVELDGDCWVWQAAVNSAGYPVRGDGNGSVLLVHRQQYEQRYGPIPPGRDLHHLCATPRCVNPAHLEAVTRLEHAARHRATWGRKRASK